ncbi:MAG: PDZ domain-containing protein [Fuerstiella sp.]|nr:PDZ domain-containing protein [Fuerstiella sp.]
MKLTIMSVLLFAGLAISSLSHAEDESVRKQTKKSQSVEVVVESTSEKTDDSNARTSVKGRIVIEGPDGKRQEYDLGESLSGGVKINVDDLPQLHRHLQVGGADSHMIGIMCEPASDLLRRHLKLLDQGLLASHVSEGLPAAAAGIRKDDILLSVGEQKLNHVPDLVKVVSGSEGNELTVDLLRDGERISVAVTPRKVTGEELTHMLKPLTLLHRHQAGEQGEGIAGVFSEIEQISGDKGTPHVFLRSFGPGMRLDDSAGPHERQHILHLIKRMAEKQNSADPDADEESATGARGKTSAETKSDASSVDRELIMKVLKMQVEQLRSQVSAIEKQLAETKEK